LTILWTAAACTRIALLASGIYRLLLTRSPYALRRNQLRPIAAPDSQWALICQHHDFTGFQPREIECHTYREGYAGILSRRWNGRAEFSVTRRVAEAIVRRHQRDFTNLMRQHNTGGDPADAWLTTLRSMASVTWLAEMIVVDSRGLHDDDTSVHIAAPSPQGRYLIGWGWMWDDVEAADIHTVHTGQSR
jgi:hypothetical protein